MSKPGTTIVVQDLPRFEAECVASGLQVSIDAGLLSLHLRTPSTVRTRWACQPSSISSKTVRDLLCGKFQSLSFVLPVEVMMIWAFSSDVTPTST